MPDPLVRQFHKSCRYSDGSRLRQLPPHAGSGLGLRVSRNLVWQELERHKSVQACILGLVHHTHSTPELPEDAVVRDGLANHKMKLCNLRFRGERKSTRSDSSWA